MGSVIIPDPGSLGKYRFDQQPASGTVEPLYDYIAYPNAGAQQLSFFGNPRSNGRSYEDTNMELAGQLASPKSFLVQYIQILFFSGADIETYLSAVAPKKAIADVLAIAKSGWLEFTVDNKTVKRDGPLGLFAPPFRLGGMAAVADGSALTAPATQLDSIGYASVAGAAYAIEPELIPANTSFSVTLNWKAAVALPSGVDGRIGVRLFGAMYRSGSIGG